jgi:L-amino acid N-acyltransferase
MIRPAAKEDFPQITKIWNQIIRDTAATFTNAEKEIPELVQANAAGRPFFAAEEDGKVVGFATYFPFRSGPGYARTKEHTIQLSPNARGKGLGRALMDAVEDHARDAGVHSIWAGISSENPDGKAFHAALGYEEIAVLPEVGRKFGRWMDLILMRKVL